MDTGKLSLLSSCLLQYPIPPENMPICLRAITMNVVPDNLLSIAWYTVTLVPTAKPRFRVWNIVIGGLVSQSAVYHKLVFYLTFTGTTSYVINWEKFPIV